MHLINSCSSFLDNDQLKIFAMSSHRILIVTVVLASLCSLATSYPGNGVNVLRHLLNRQACYDDDVLVGFKQNTIDSETFCRSLLGIQDITTTLPPVVDRM